MEKVRVRKGYRDPQLDEALRGARTRTEARLFREARTLGVAVPVLYDVDLPEDRLVMELVEGPTAKEALEASPEGGAALCREVGRLAGRLHAGGVVHGDLTTSNMVVRGTSVCLIDFGLGERSEEREALGVDLHLLREAFLSAHAARAELFQEVLQGYREAWDGAEAVIAKAEEIERRGRYMRGS